MGESRWWNTIAGAFAPPSPHDPLGMTRRGQAFHVQQTQMLARVLSAQPHLFQEQEWQNIQQVTPFCRYYDLHIVHNR